MKKRTKKLSEFFRSYEPYGHKVNQIQEVLVTDISHDKNYFVSHNEFYEQVLVPKKEEYMGKMLIVKIVEATKFSMIGEVMEKPKMPGLTSPLKKGEVSGLEKMEKYGKMKIPVSFYFVLLAVFLRILWMML